MKKLIPQPVKKQIKKLIPHSLMTFDLPAPSPLELRLLGFSRFHPELPGHCQVMLRDLQGLFEPEHADLKHYRACLDWLLRAQEIHPGGGFSAGYTFDNGWLPDYPETTGYIIPTLWEAFNLFKEEKFREAACLAADWEIEIQLQSGAVMAGYYGEDPSGFWKKEVVPAAFNTGQVMQGWNQTFIETQEPRFLEASKRAANYLLSCLDERGVFVGGLSPGPTNILRSYYTRVAHALAWTGVLAMHEPYIAAARRYLDWVLTQQNDRGWVANAMFHVGDAPLTHNLAYVAEGWLDAGLLLSEPKYIEASKQLVVAVQHTCERRGFFLPATLDEDLKSPDKFSCLTGNAQFASLWLRHGELNRDLTLINSGLKMTDWLKGVHSLANENPGIQGAIAGDWPLDGGYSQFRFLNWPTKFYADALLLRINILEILEANEKVQEYA